jgi:hypothetical protein
MWSTTFEHFFQLFCMATIILGSRAFSMRAQGDRLRGDAQRLRSALTINLQALRKHYQENLSILSGGELPLISGRNQINLLRTQLGRLTSLDPPEIEAVMTASVAAEMAETEMAKTGTRNGGIAFTIPEIREARTLLASTLRDACSALQIAEELVHPKDMKHCENLSDEPSNFAIGEPRETVSVSE